MKDGFSWRWPLILACVLLTAGGTWAVFENFVWSRIPTTLAGKWVITGGDQDGATFDFYRNGSMVGHINLQGREGIIRATVAVEGDQLLITTQNPDTGRY